MEMQRFGIYELDLSNYYNRLITFKNWPLVTPVSASKLASAGFYYCQSGTLVQCFSCLLSISEWVPPDNNPLTRHKESSPLCVFINSIKTESASDDSETLNKELSKVARSKPEEHEHNFVAKFNEAVKLENDNEQPLTCLSDSANVKQDTPEKHQNMALDRFDTEKCKNVCQKEQEQGHDANECDTDSNQNVSDNSILRQEPKQNYHLNEVDYSQLEDQNFAMAKHPQYTSPQKRLKTFRSWSYHNVQHPQRLLEAGFYYTGSTDEVRCFHCDLRLTEWTVEDDPWVEHARHGPQCYFLREKQGMDFIDNVQRSWREIYKPKQPQFEDYHVQNFTFKRWPTNLDQLAVHGFYYTDDNDTLKNDANRNALSMAVSISVLEMGYRKTTLIMAINEYLKRTGNRNFTTEDLLDVILETNTDESPKDDDGTEKSSSEKDNKEVRQGKKQNKNEFFLCKMCKVRDRNTVFLPCGHLETCELCAEKTMICFTCGDFVNKIYPKMFKEFHLLE